MADVAPAQWIREEVTFELRLGGCAKLVISHREKACLATGAVDTGFCLPSLHSSFVDLSPFGDLPLGIYLPSLLMCFVWGGCQPVALGWLCDLGLVSQS